jgi:hypothetical protein
MNEREPTTPAEPAEEEPEPDWAQQIRDLRKARGTTLAEQLADEDRPEPPV